MLRAVSNSVLIKIGNVFTRNISNIMKGSFAYAHGSKINPADVAQLVGEVISVPKIITNYKLGYQGFSVKNIQKGDTAIFRYDVVYAFQKDNKGFKNLFWYKGREYWAADIIKIFAVIREGQIFMLNGYCMVEDVKEKSKLIVANTVRDIDNISYATLTQIGDNLEGLPTINAHAGDKIYFDPKKLQQYELNGKSFGIVRQKDVLAVDVVEFNTLQLVK